MTDVPSDPAAGPHVTPGVGEILDDARFPLRLRGYDPVEVDHLLDRLEQAIARTGPHHGPPGTQPVNPLARHSGVTPVTTPTDPALTGISTQTFRLVRKGFDPEEVRNYLTRVEAAVSALAPGQVGAAPAAGDPAAARQAQQVLAEAHAQAEAMVAEAQGRLEQLERQKAAVQAWFGEDGRADPGSVPPEIADAAGRAQAMVRAAQVQVDELLRGAEADVETTRADRWSDLGVHVARILANAEEEAASITAAAEESAADIRRRADRDRIQARDQLAEVELRAQALVSEAEARAVEIRQTAEPRARAHIAEVLAQARGDLDATRSVLREAHGRLEEVHDLVGRSLALRLMDPVLDDAESFPLDSPLPPSSAAPGAPVPSSATTPAPAPPVPSSATTPAPAPPVPSSATTPPPTPSSAAPAPAVPPTAATATPAAPGAPVPPPATMTAPAPPLAPRAPAGVPPVPPATAPLPPAPPAPTAATSPTLPGRVWAPPAPEAAVRVPAPPAAGPPPLASFDHREPGGSQAGAGQAAAPPAPGLGDEAAWAAFVGSETELVGAERDRSGPDEPGPSPDDASEPDIMPDRRWTSRLRSDRQT